MQRSRLKASSYSIGWWYSRFESRPACITTRWRGKTYSWLQLSDTSFLVCLILLNTMIIHCSASNGSETVEIRTGNESTTDRCSPFEELRLTELSDDPRICDCLNRLKSREQALEVLRKFQLGFCNAIRVQDAVSFLMNTTICTDKLKDILRAEQNALKAYNNFLEIMSRVDCSVAYSVRWTCWDCQDAYKNWLCHSEVLAKVSPKKQKTCLPLCNRVLQRCPYFLPDAEYQWSGQSAFECENDKDEDEAKNDEDCFIVSETRTERTTAQRSITAQKTDNSRQVADKHSDLKDSS